jgi:hypothetical protein
MKYIRLDTFVPLAGFNAEVLDGTTVVVFGDVSVSKPLVVWFGNVSVDGDGVIVIIVLVVVKDVT